MDGAVAAQITPLPGGWPLKPGSATLPFFGVQVQCSCLQLQSSLQYSFVPKWRSRASASHSLRALYYRFFLQLSQLGKLQCGICSLLFLSGKLVLQGTNASATLTASNSEWEWTWDFWRVQWLLVYQSTMAWHHEDPSRRSCTLWNNIFCTI
jgi:hypothetical protein